MAASDFALGPRSHTNLLVGHGYARVIGPDRGLQLGRINFPTLRPLDKVSWTILWISAPPLKYADVNRLVDVGVGAVFANFGLRADGAIESGGNQSVQSLAERVIGIDDRRFQCISIERDF